MLEGLAETCIYKVRYDKRDTSYAEAHVIRRREFLDVVLRECRQIARCAHRRSQLLKFCQRLGRHVGTLLEILVCKCGNLTVIYQTVLSKEVVGDPLGHTGSEHGADVDGHVEDRECVVSFCLICGIIVEIAHQYLQVTLEETRTAGYERQRTEHERLTCETCISRYGQQRISDKHDEDTERDHLAEAELVGQNTSEEGHEIDCGEEDAVDLRGDGLGVAELRLQEQREDRKHGIVAEALTRIGQRKGIQTFWLSFEHNEFLVYC